MFEDVKKVSKIGAGELTSLHPMLSVEMVRG
jgi:hypothetical protein